MKHTFTNQTSIQGGVVGYQYADRIGALFEFPSNTTTVTSKVGLSWISAEKACRFMDEIPNWDMEATVQAAKDQWNEEVLSKIDVQTDNKTQLDMFYTGMYHSHLLPSDRSGENPYWDSEEPYYDGNMPPHGYLCARIDIFVRLLHALGYFPVPHTSHDTYSAEPINGNCPRTHRHLAP